MNRPKTTGKALPPRMLKRTKTLKSGVVWVGYYYNGRDGFGKRKEIPLGTDLNEAKRKWAELEHVAPAEDTGLMNSIFARYQKEIIPSKAPRTQKDNLAEIELLKKTFGAMNVNKITTAHIAQYRDRRGAKAAVRANREIALFSHVFNLAREWGYTNNANPARGLRRNKETPRDNYVTDDVFNAVRDCACIELRDAMDLAYLTGQRPADVLKMRWADVRDGFLEVGQNKTAKRLRIEVTGQLDKLLDEIRRRKVSGATIICTPTGKSLTKWTLRTRFEAARNAAAVTREDLAPQIERFQYRDLRPKAASEIELTHAKELLGHSKEQITEAVYRRVGAKVKPTR